MASKFVHLHVHSHYSLLDGLPKIEALVDYARSLKMSALALTDHGALYGAIKFYQKATEAGLQPIIGEEFYLAPYGMYQKSSKMDQTRYHLVILAKNQRGYHNLIKLTTKAHLEGFYYKPRIDKALLKKHAQGLIGLSGCLSGEIPKALAAGDWEKAKKAAFEYQKIFGPGNFYLELGYHPNIPEQARVSEGLITLAKKYGFPLVATNDVHYLKKEEKEPQDALVAIRTKKKLDDKDRISLKRDDFSFLSGAEMEKNFSHLPQALENTQKIAQKCRFKISLGKTRLPHYVVPEKETPLSFLKKLCYQGLETRYRLKSQRLSREKFKLLAPPKKAKGIPTQEIIDRLEYELSVIRKTGFASYFLIVQDVVNWAKSQGIVVGPGRGSSASSLVSYLLNITNIDPLKYELLFERFLNPKRVAGMADIDLDFADHRRDEVIEYVRQKYGQANVAQIITFGTMAARAAVRDVGRVLGEPYGLCDQLAKQVPFGLSLDQALETSLEFRRTYEQNPRARKIIDLARKLEGVARHASTHACGLVITKKPVDFFTPRQYASQSDQTVVTQYDMHDVEALGLLKMDFLGLKNLTIIEKTLEIIKERTGKTIDIEKIPLDDPQTYKLLQKGETTACFQLESNGMKGYLRQLKPTCFEDIIAMVALYRPGPMELIPQFIARKHGQEKITFLHPKLKPILKRTYGIMVYQEQLLQVAQELAGFSLAEADILRKAVGKKIRSLLQKQKYKLIRGMTQKGISRDKALKIWQWIQPFARYGFNRAHATCYALIAYQTAFLKAHFTTEFFTALLNSKQDDIEKIAFLITDARKFNIEVLPPDINESWENFKATSDQTIRFGLKAIKNVGSNIVQAIIKQREAQGPFRDIGDLIQRIKVRDLNKKSLESLIKAGALDSLEERNRLLCNLDKILKASSELKKEKARQQNSLFEGLAHVPTFSLSLEKAPPASFEQKLSWEKELLGLYVSGHPLKNHHKLLQEKTIPLAKLNHTHQGRRVVIGGILEEIKKINTRNGEPMLFTKVKDLTDEAEVIVFSDILRKNPTVWQKEKIALLTVRVQNRNGQITLICEKAQELT